MSGPFLSYIFQRSTKWWCCVALGCFALGFIPRLITLATMKLSMSTGLVVLLLLQELALGSTGSRMARRKALGLGSGAEGRRRHRYVAGGMADDGSYVGPGGGAAGLLCLLLAAVPSLVSLTPCSRTRVSWFKEGLL